MATWRLDRTTRFERFLLAAAVALLPFQDQAAIRGVKLTFLAFGFIGLVVLLRRSASFFTLANHGAMVPLYVFVMVSFAMETLHPDMAWDEQRRTVVMVFEAMTIAGLCRDRRALLTVLRAVVWTGSALAALFAVTSYGPLRSTSAANFSQISAFRDQVLSKTPLGVDINSFAFLMAMGAGVALAFSLGASSHRQRRRYQAAVVLCTLGVVLSLSRGGLLVETVAVVVVILGLRRRRVRSLAAMALGAVAVWAVVPRTVFLRLSVASVHSAGHVQATSRVGLYEASVHNLRGYALAGVGQGHFWSSWAGAHGFQDIVGPVFGAHDSVFQVWMYWGLAGVAALGWVCWSLYRNLPQHSGEVTTRLALRAVAAASFAYLFFTHNFYRAEFAVALGVLLAARIWGVTAPSGERSCSGSGRLQSQR